MNNTVNCVSIPEDVPFVVIDSEGNLHHPVEVAFVGQTSDEVSNLIDRFVTLVESQSPDKTTTNFISRMPRAGGVGQEGSYAFEAFDATKLGEMKVLKASPDAAPHFMVRGSIFRWNGTVTVAVPVEPDTERFTKLADELPAEIPEGATGEFAPLGSLEYTKAFYAATGVTGEEMPVVPTQPADAGNTGATEEPVLPAQPDAGTGASGATDAVFTTAFNSNVAVGPTLQQKFTLDVKGYTPQDQSKIDTVNENKVLEERVLRRIEELMAVPKHVGVSTSDGNYALHDTRMLRVAFTYVQDAFMWMNRAVFQPERVALPEDEQA